MYYILSGHSYVNEVQTAIQIFYPNIKYRQTDGIAEEGLTVVSSLQEGAALCECYLNAQKQGEERILISSHSQVKACVKDSVFLLLKKLTGLETPWGNMTGIRPAKKAMELLSLYDEQRVLTILQEDFHIRRDKAELAIRVAKEEEKILSASNSGSASLYIGIPFCPTRCLYCSFPSYPAEKYQDLILNYLKALFKELEYIKTLPYTIETIYIGGGTPTSLNEACLDDLLSKVHSLFFSSDIKEFTVECGRPDTLNPEKLRLLKDWQVSRISINPQTLKQETLERIGRRHTIEDFYRAFEMARTIGHDTINTDLILGLPGESAEDVKNTLAGIKRLSPENLTVHTLAVKRASALHENLGNYDFTDIQEMEKMLALSSSCASDMAMIPYYMYRQKNMTGNFENVGYAKKGRQCIYNVQMMEERQSILSAGAGAVTKTVDIGLNKIERVFNVKEISQYINRIDEMIERKRKVVEA